MKRRRHIPEQVIRKLAEGITACDCRPQVHAADVKRVDDAHSRMVWSHPAVNSWYRNLSGRVISPTPWRFVDYWAMTHEARLTDYVLTRP
ncbi:MAG: hypothetical protein ACR2KC_03380 [Acidimicrobiales bacterium]